MIFEGKKKFKFLHRNYTETCSVSLYTGIPQKPVIEHFPPEFARAKNSVFYKYLRNEMRPAKMKSFRLNRILRRMFEQSFEEIGDTSVVGRRSSVSPFHSYINKTRCSHAGAGGASLGSITLIAFVFNTFEVDDRRSMCMHFKFLTTIV